MSSTNQRDREHSARIQPELEKLEQALGGANCQVFYDEGDDTPWRITDGKATETYASVEEAIEAAPEWRTRAI